MSDATHRSAGDGKWSGGTLRSCGDPPTPPVLKIGGSLLARDGWPALLRDLVALRECQGCLVVVGGGAIVNGLRAIDAAGRLSERLSHDAAIDAMGITARIVAEAIAAPLLASPVAGGVHASVLDVPEWLRSDGMRDDLPVGWHVTSDSIAAVAARAAHRRLILAKSVPPPAGCDDPIAASVAAGWIDPHFPEAAIGIGTISWLAPCESPHDAVF